MKKLFLLLAFVAICLVSPVGAQFGPAGINGIGNSAISSSSPSPTPSPTPTPPAGLPANGPDWPTSFIPFDPVGPWNSPIPSTPSIASDSATIIAAQFPNGYMQAAVRMEEPGEFDASHNIYFTSNSDPVVTLTDHTVSGAGVLPSTMHIPSWFRCYPSDTDNHMAFVQPDATELDFYIFNNSFGTCNTSTSWGSGGNTAWSVYGLTCGNILTGDGIQLGGSTGLDTTAGGACGAVGMVRPNELAAGVINHAIFLLVPCTANGGVYPGRNQNTSTCSGPGPKLGYRLHYKDTVANTNANGSLHLWEKAILNALHTYGGYVMDNSCPNGDNPFSCTIGTVDYQLHFMTIGEESAWNLGSGDQWSQLASQGWTSNTSLGPPGYPRWTGADPWNPPVPGGLRSQLEYIAPCVTDHTC